MPRLLIWLGMGIASWGLLFLLVWGLWSAGLWIWAVLAQIKEFLL
jgi:hypothetical protein